MFMLVLMLGPLLASLLVSSGVCASSPRQLHGFSANSVLRVEGILVGSVGAAGIVRVGVRVGTAAGVVGGVVGRKRQHTTPISQIFGKFWAQS